MAHLDRLPTYTDKKCETGDTRTIHTRWPHESRGADATQRLRQVDWYLH